MRARFSSRADCVYGGAVEQKVARLTQPVVGAGSANKKLGVAKRVAGVSCGVEIDNSIVALSCQIAERTNHGARKGVRFY